MSPKVLDRRAFLGRGFAALSFAMCAGDRRLAAQVVNPYLPTGGGPLWSTNPIRATGPLGQSTQIGGLPFSQEWFGDWFPSAKIPFHGPDEALPGGVPPDPQESTDIAIVGGGLSGLAMGYLLRHHRPVIFDLHSRFGGTSQGEQWGNTAYSLGGAYFIAPDEGSFLEGLYRELGIDRLARLSPPSDDPTELNGEIVPGFWRARGLSQQEREAFRQYAAIVQTYVDQYPEIPLLENEDNAWILALDAVSLKSHLASLMTVPVPTLLRSAIQAYCYSSFNAGWDEISAASAWNFIAAEEYGRWVLPGGNAGLATALWSRIAPLDARTPRGCPPRHLRSSCRVVDVRVLGSNRCQVTWRDDEGVFRSLIAKRVVICSPKHVAKHIIPNLEATDFDLNQAMQQVETNAYVVANVLLDRPIRRDFYDLFLLRDGSSPDGPQGVEDYSRVTDAVNATFARCHHSGGDALTLYWPLPFATGRFSLVAQNSLQDFAAELSPQVTSVLDVLEIPRRHVRQVRLSRWGHSMPIASPNFISRGFPAVFRRPLQDHVFFCNADNWSLPAVETCLLEAAYQAPRVAAGL